VWVQDDLCSFSSGKLFFLGMHESNSKQTKSKLDHPSFSLNTVLDPAYVVGLADSAEQTWTCWSLPDPHTDGRGPQQKTGTQDSSTGCPEGFPHHGHPHTAMLPCGAPSWLPLCQRSPRRQRRPVSRPRPAASSTPRPTKHKRQPRVAVLTRLQPAHAARLTVHLEPLKSCSPALCLHALQGSGAERRDELSSQGRVQEGVAASKKYQKWKSK